MESVKDLPPILGEGVPNLSTDYLKRVVGFKAGIEKRGARSKSERSVDRTIITQ